jgi:DNA-binding response OmpR family regulator
MGRVLVVEDEAAIAELIALHLRHEGHEPRIAISGPDAQAALLAQLPDLIVLDWMLPGDPGISLLARWRQDPRTKALPVIMLTARAQESDKIKGLDVGADDYLTKPFSPAELMARVRALLRRPRPRGARRTPAGRQPAPGPGRTARLQRRRRTATRPHRVPPAALPDEPPRARAQPRPVARQGVGGTMSSSKNARSTCTSSACATRSNQSAAPTWLRRCAVRATD